MRFVPISEAAVTYKCSERTLRRKIDAGTIAARRESGRLLVAVDPTQMDGSRRLGDVAASLAVSSKVTSDAFAAALTNAQDAAIRAEKRAQVAQRATVIATASLVTLVMVAAVVSVMAVNRYRDRIDTVQADHRDRIDGLRADHQTVLLDLRRRAATADGVASARFDELGRAAERLDAVTRDRDVAQAAIRGERPDGTPILLASTPE